MKRFLLLTAATLSAAAIPLVSAESWVNVTNESTITINGETKTMKWSYTSTDSNHSAPFSMPPMPAMPDIPGIPPIPAPVLPAVPPSTSVLAATHSMPSMAHFSSMMEQAKTRFAKVRLCRETYLQDPPFNAEMRKNFRICVHTAMGIPMGNLSSTSRSSSSSSSPVSSVAGTVQATISGFAFQPQLLQVKKGTTVTWTNQDNAAHTVTGNAGGPDSPSIAKGQTYSYTFDTVGNYPYYCKPHPNMTGIVQVTD